MILAQITTAVSTAPSTLPAAPAPTTAAAALEAAQSVPLVFHAPGTHEIFSAVGAAAGTLVAGLIVIWALRRFLERTKLSHAVLVATIAMAVLLGITFLVHLQTAVRPYSDIEFWVVRICAAAMTYVLLRFIDRLALVPLLTRGGRVPLPRFFHQILYILLALFAILIFGSVALGWDIDRFLAGSAVVSIVLGLALQESLGNFFSGLVMQASPPFALGNWIVCADHEGRVVDMTWRAVTIQTSDDNFIVIPNATVAKADITNFHAPTTATARSLKVGLDYDVAPCDAIAVLKGAALESAGVLREPEPFVYLHEFTDAAVMYRIKFWIDEPAKHPKIEHAVRQNVWYRLHGRGFGIPFPTFNIEHISLERKQRAQGEKARGHRVAAIESVPLFQMLTLEQVRTLADSTDDYLLSPGQILFRQDEEGDSFYIIRSGTVDVLVKTGNDERLVATLKPGDFFGEMSALTGQPRSATIRAATAIALVRVEKRDLLALFEADRSLLEKISEVVARRNADREAIIQGAGAVPAPEMVVRQQKSLLGRMMSFFRLSTAA